MTISAPAVSNPLPLHHDDAAIPAAISGAAPGTSVLRLPDSAALRARFPHETFPIGHDLTQHPLFALPRLIELARALPRDQLEYNSGNVGITQAADDTPTVDLEPAEIIRRIETCGAWLVLKRVESDPAYRALLEDILDGVAHSLGHASRQEADFQDIRGFLFVSSPNSTTPFHADGEDNFFVQIHGDKFFHVYDNRDHGIASEAQLEHIITRHRNLTFDERYDAAATHYSLKPGDGIFVPYLWPHWIRTGDSYSISLAITWKTKPVLWRNDGFVVNSMLRALGLPQPDQGRWPAYDAMKIHAYRALRATLQPLRKSEGMRRLLRRLVLGRKANYYYREAGQPAE
ncbi:MAG TPA: cupin-like domain-containing protein [Xanthobacteraceae bacterium]|nr:cupin-like domain-containing protein [Xanthobacteraceae bacterium]